MFKFLTDNFETIATLMVLLLPLMEVVVRITPTKSDDTAIDIFKKLFNKIPNRKTGGGVHRKSKKLPTETL